VARYVFFRLIGLTFSIAMVSVLTFFLMHSIPGGPFAFDKQPLPDFAMNNILHKYGLDRPVYVQYLSWVGAMLHGDFGIPFQSPTETVVGVIARAWPVTMAIGIPTIIIAFSFGITLGSIAALNQNTWIDNVTTFLATLGMTIPNFVVAIWLVMIFSIKLGWLPTGGWGEPEHLIMPVIAYSIGPLALIARLTRANTLEVTRADHVRLARVRGIPRRLILWRYILRNSLIPLITIFLPLIPDLLTGSIFIETTFAIPGLGRFFTTSALQRDYPMIMAMMMLIAVVWGMTYLFTDVLYTMIDPRVRLTAAEG
jgi:peptide/nickel transport system permease protein